MLRGGAGPGSSSQRPAQPNSNSARGRCRGPGGGSTGGGGEERKNTEDDQSSIEHRPPPEPHRGPSIGPTTPTGPTDPPLPQYRPHDPPTDAPTPPIRSSSIPTAPPGADPEALPPALSEKRKFRLLTGSSGCRAEVLQPSGRSPALRPLSGRPE